MNVFETLHDPHVSQGGTEEGTEIQVIDLPFTLPSLIRLVYLQNFFCKGKICPFMCKTAQLLNVVDVKWLNIITQ